MLLEWITPTHSMADVRFLIFAMGEAVMAEAVTADLALMAEALTHPTRQ